MGCGRSSLGRSGDSRRPDLALCLKPPSGAWLSLACSVRNAAQFSWLLLLSQVQPWPPKAASYCGLYRAINLPIFYSQKVATMPLALL